MNDQQLLKEVKKRVGGSVGKVKDVGAAAGGCRLVVARLRANSSGFREATGRSGWACRSTRSGKDGIDRGTVRVDSGEILTFKATATPAKFLRCYGEVRY